MGMLFFPLLLLVPLISSETSNQADLGFTCDDKKCTFSLAIPQSAVEFVDVDLLESEICGLNQNVTDLRASEKLINDDEESFVFDFDALYEVAQANLTDMSDLASHLNETTPVKLAEAQAKQKEASDLNDALKCMVAGVLSPAECGKNVPDTPTTLAPPEPTDDSSGKTDEPTKAPFTGTTTTEEPFTGTTTTKAPYTGPTTTEEEKTTTTGAGEPSLPTDETQSTPKDVSTTSGEPGKEATDATSTTPVETSTTAEYNPPSAESTTPCSPTPC